MEVVWTSERITLNQNQMKKEKLLEYVLQLFMVIIGVFLGMMASDWSSNRNFKEDKTNLLIGLRSELSNNLTYLENRKSKDLMPFFEVLDSLTNALKTQPDILAEPFKDRNFSERLPKFPGLGRAQLDDAMFDAAKFSGILSTLNIKLLQQLTKSYNLQNNIHETRKSMYPRLLDIDSNTIYGDVLDIMWEIMESYFGAQYNLIKEYKKAITLINKEL